MKCISQRLVLVALLAASLAMVGCGDGGGTASTGAANEIATPGEVVTQLAEAMEAGDADKIKELMPDVETKLGGNLYTNAQRMATSAQAVGGVESVTIDDETIKGDKAVVTATLTNGDGTSSTNTFQLVKQDGKWIVTLDDSEMQDDSQE